MWDAVLQDVQSQDGERKKKLLKKKAYISRIYNTLQRSYIFKVALKRLSVSYLYFLRALIIYIYIYMYIYIANTTFNAILFYLMPRA